MKPQEILLASALIALVGGAGAAVATRAFLPSAGRTSAGRTPALSAPAEGATDASGELQELKSAQAQLLQRIAALEVRLAETRDTRTAASLASDVDEAAVSAPLASPDSRRRAVGEAVDLSPDFVASVEQALTRIKSAEEAEREKARKELQAQRIEERVARLQQTLGLNRNQATDLRTALIQQEDKRDALFASMRDGNGDPGAMRDSFRTLRDEAQTQLQTILTPDQYAAYQKTEESEFGRRGFGDFGPPGGRPEGGFGRPEGGSRPR